MKDSARAARRKEKTPRPRNREEKTQNSRAGPGTPRLSDNAPPDAAESETVFRSCGSNDDPPGCWGNADAGNQAGNLDVRVPERTTKVDGLCARGAKERKDADTEEQGGEDAELESGTGNSVVPLKTDYQPWEKIRATSQEGRGSQRYSPS
ncbi:hypothetical protein NDU88_002455 [Pleurodeles waltl]|uniref:Uncharacterized protein n=1 Tax=Pleurodeles waltl TaxID=8319 RepID=A0AAV7TL87_PLEWA|nr:hypothetical protein NDU88_002455 [Pleurodeles waltl]